MLNTRSVIFITKVVITVIKFFGGSASTWPGEIALFLNRNFIKKIIAKNPELKTIFVVGTNGKTTTTKLISHILEKQGLANFSNNTGANLLNGIATTLIRNIKFSGKCDYKVAIFEVDENVLPLLLEQFRPDGIIVLNLFRDQLDRYGEVNIISIKWNYAFSKLGPKTNLIINADDPETFVLGQNAKKATVKYFGIGKKLMKTKEVPHEADSIYCPVCFSRLTFNAFAYSHLGDYFCPKCGLAPKEIYTLPDSIKLPLLGLFNIYNLTAAVLITKELFEISDLEINTALSDFKSAFGRQEPLLISGRKVIIQLAKNPTGFSQDLELLSVNKKENVLLVLNNRIPDGRDVSWIWDINFNGFFGKTRKIFLGGDRVFDLCIRLSYLEPSKIYFKRKDDFYISDKIIFSPDLKTLLWHAIKSTPEGEHLYIFPTYSAMLEIRSLLTGDQFEQ